eukprot:COSAG01_NODE_5320_length_4335_cov_8.874646_3_plen_115_part_00
MLVCVEDLTEGLDYVVYTSFIVITLVHYRATICDTPFLTWLGVSQTERGGGGLSGREMSCVSIMSCVWGVLLCVGCGMCRAWGCLGGGLSYDTSANGMRMYEMCSYHIRTRSKS